jgi:hypothetical protein
MEELAQEFANAMGDVNSNGQGGRRKRKKDNQGDGNNNNNGNGDALVADVKPILFDEDNLEASGTIENYCYLCEKGNVDEVGDEERYPFYTRLVNIRQKNQGKMPDIRIARLMKDYFDREIRPAEKYMLDDGRVISAPEWTLDMVLAHNTKHRASTETAMYRLKSTLINSLEDIRRSMRTQNSITGQIQIDPDSVDLLNKLASLLMRVNKEIATFTQRTGASR